MPTCKSSFKKFTSHGKVEHKSSVPYTLSSLYSEYCNWTPIGTIKLVVNFYTQLNYKCSVFALVI